MDNRFGKKIKWRLATVVILGLFIFLLTWLADYPATVERYYSKGFYPFICKILHPVFNLLPFSFGDVLYAVVILYLIYALVMLIKLPIKRRFKEWGMLASGIVIGVEAGIVIFYLFWGMNYFRLPAATRLKLQDTVYSTDELKTVANILIDSANAARGRLNHTDLRQQNDSIYSSSIRAVVALAHTSAEFYTYKPSIKPSSLSWLLNYIGTSGYYNPFTAEAQFNYQMPLHVRPFVACHEMSHQAGFGSEDEANFAGFLAGIRSADRLLRYSAYYEGMQECMYSLRATDTVAFKLLRAKINPAVIIDLKAERAYWQYYQGKLEVISSLFYDKFLKVNNQPQGLLTYNQMVSLIMAMYRKSPAGTL
ncbi:DUF3810 domain-containing protein [Mucilaginibacter gynuensis]|uniref:DUF3810 domain-containing protein n=1 Tax=Mucilaginibacter gynuensis TaxID=1302236 RepID=A0ABP8H636_9SPHI